MQTKDYAPLSVPEILQNQVLLRKSSGKVKALPLLGGTCLKYIPTVFRLAREVKKAKAGGSLAKLGKSSCGSHLWYWENNPPLIPTHKTCGGPAIWGASLGEEGWQQFSRDVGTIKE